jgi:hypothetical protein
MSSVLRRATLHVELAMRSSRVPAWTDLTVHSLRVMLTSSKTPSSGRFTECPLRHASIALTHAQTRSVIPQYDDDMYVGVARTRVDNSRQPPRTCCALKHRLMGVGPRGRKRRCAGHWRKARHGAKAQYMPRRQIRRNTCPGSLSKKMGIGRPRRSRFVSRALSLSLSLESSAASLSRSESSDAAWPIRKDRLPSKKSPQVVSTQVVSQRPCNYNVAFFSMICITPRRRPAPMNPAKI